MPPGEKLPQAAHMLGIRRVETASSQPGRSVRYRVLTLLAIGALFAIVAFV